jgi:phosphoribosylanthranilate isomerase
VVKAIGVSTREDLEQVKDFKAADVFLLDAKPPAGADREGGHGRPFDWSILEGFDPGKPWVLSGGLTPENVAEAIRISGAKAVDVSSGVEASPGVKDAAKVKAFIEAAKGA